MKGNHPALGIRPGKGSLTLRRPGLGVSGPSAGGVWVWSSRAGPGDTG